ncbi:MAG: hypothetical protein LJE91_12485, partial [Gammaproteobacteria bacterium]|nr:hypothetical protein [Gammaproteobacteria bacterium]
VDFRGIFRPDKADSMRNAAPLQVESNAVRAEKIRKAAVHDECQQSLTMQNSYESLTYPRFIG